MKPEYCPTQIQHRSVSCKFMYYYPLQHCRSLISLNPAITKLALQLGAI